MRLSPVENPKSLMVRFAYWMSRKRLGKVMTPLKTVFARIPKLLFAQYGVTRVLEGGLSIGYGLQFLVQHQVAAMNDCGFCVDIGRAMAVQYELDLAKLEALPKIVAEMVKPAEKIESIRIHHLSGFGSVQGQPATSKAPLNQALDSIMEMAVQLPALKKIGEDLALNFGKDSQDNAQDAKNN